MKRAARLARLGAARLYVVSDVAATHGRDLLWCLSEAIAGGADVVQLRWKGESWRGSYLLGEEIARMCRKTGVLFVVNDRADACVALKADGVHVGEDDLPVDAARRVVGPDRIVGASVSSASVALACAAAGADYVSASAVFATPSKVDARVFGPYLVGEVHRAVKVPVFAIGGVDERNVEEVVKAGASGVAVIRAVLSADDPRAAAARLRESVREARGER